MRFAFYALLLSVISAMTMQAQDPTRIIIFGAHPDDCEADVGGTAALMANVTT